LRPSALALLVLLLASLAPCAETPDGRASMAQQLADAMSHNGVHTLYVPDFCDSNSQPNGPGAYFAAVFSAMLQKRGKDFTVLSRVDVHRFLLQKQWTDCDLAKPEILSQFAAALGGDAILTGHVTPEKNYFNVDLILHDGSGQSKVHWVYQEPYGPYTLSSFPATASSTGWPFYFPLLDGVTHPKPLKLPNNARAYPPHMLGTIVISVLVSADGSVEQARVVQKLDPDDDSECLSELKHWRFEPARNSDGTAVPVRISIYFKFHGQRLTYPFQAQYPEDRIP
jgi:TonB family protein